MRRSGVPEVTSRQLESIQKIQKVFRTKFYKFNRIKLIDRLVIESLFVSTSIRFLLFVVLFASVGGMIFCVPFDNFYVMSEFITDKLNPDATWYESQIHRQELIVQNSLAKDYILQSQVLAFPDIYESVDVVDGIGVTISGFIRSIPDSPGIQTIVSTDCMDWTLEKFSIGNITVDLNWVVSDWTHVAITAQNSSQFSLYFNGRIFASYDQSGFDIACLGTNIAPTLTLFYTMFGLYGKYFDDDEMTRFLAKRGLPRVQYLTGAIPKTLNNTDIAESILVPQLAAVSSGILSYKVNSNEATLLYASVVDWANNFDGTFSFAPRNTTIEGFEMTLPFFVMSRGKPILGVFTRRFDSTGQPITGVSSSLYVYLSASNSLIPWFVINIVTTCVLFALKAPWVGLKKREDDSWLGNVSTSAHFLRLQFNSARLLDFITLIANLIFSIYFFVVFIQSSDTQNTILNDMMNDIEEPADLYDVAHNWLIPACIQQKNLIDFGAMFVLYFIIWRLFSCMRFHPRIGLFVNTLSSSFSEILHYLISFFIVTTCLAIIGVFTYSEDTSIYETLAGSYYELFTVLLGDDWTDVDNNWRKSFLTVFYFIVLPILCIFTLLNFLLGVIIDTFVQIRHKTVESTRSHQNIFREIVDIPLSSALLWIFNLPARSRVVDELEQMRIQFVGIREISYIITGSSANQGRNDVIRFCQFYHSFSFLKELPRPDSTRQRISSSNGSANSIYRANRTITAATNDEGGVIDLVALNDYEPPTSAKAQMKIVADELHELLVENHLRQTEMESELRSIQEALWDLKGLNDSPFPISPPGSPQRQLTALSIAPSNREKLISEYQAERQIHNLTRAQIRVRRLKEYMTKARKDAEILIQETSSASNADSNVASNRSQRILSSFRMDESDGDGVVRNFLRNRNRKGAEMQQAGSSHQGSPPSSSFQ
jgi:hypothetical protein